MFNAQGKLDVFENFRIDYSLPKYKKQEDITEDGLTENEADIIRNVSASESKGTYKQKSRFHVSWGNSNINLGGDRFTAFVSNEPLKPWWSPARLLWLLLYPFRWLMLPFRQKPKPLQPVISIEEFFKSVKNSVEELVVVNERAKGYEAAMLKAKTGGQDALYEQLVQGLASVRSEAQLVATGLGKFLEEETVVKFVKQATKGLRLDWVANFTRVIPDAVLQPKVRADELGLFDNYVVLHFDPEAKSWAETEKEKNSRRDPILFGLMQGRRRLYYIGDWKDEFCDLTLDQIADALGKESVGVC